MAQKHPNPNAHGARPTVLPPAPPKKQAYAAIDRQCDCLNFCGDDPWLKDGRAEPCDAYKRDQQIQRERAQRTARIDELLTLLGHPNDVLGALEAAYAAKPVKWIKATDKAPDSDTTVLVSLIDNDEPVWLGYHDGYDWIDLHGFVINVIAWADIPEGPQ